MANKHVKCLKRLQRLKRYFNPTIHFLDKTRIFPIVVPIINLSLKTLKVNKRFQKDLNYRLIAKASKNGFIDLDDNKPGLGLTITDKYKSDFNIIE